MWAVSNFRQSVGGLVFYFFFLCVRFGVFLCVWQFWCFLNLCGSLGFLQFGGNLGVFMSVWAVCSLLLFVASFRIFRSL